MDRTPDGTIYNVDFEGVEDAIWDVQEPVGCYGGLLDTDDEGRLVTMSKTTVYVSHPRCSHR